VVLCKFSTVCGWSYLAETCSNVHLFTLAVILIYILVLLREVMMYCVLVEKGSDFSQNLVTTVCSLTKYSLLNMVVFSVIAPYSHVDGN
jgi:hypothetical protein